MRSGVDEVAPPEEEPVALAGLPAVPLEWEELPLLLQAAVPVNAATAASVIANLFTRTSN